jgi:Ion transport protein
MASEFYSQPDWLTQVQLIANYVFTASFTFEMLIKMFGKGLFEYFSENFNTFDCFVVLMSYLDILLSQSNTNLGIIKAFRLLRIFKLIQKWQKFRKLLRTLSDSIGPIINLGVLMILYLFISALLMKNIF